MQRTLPRVEGVRVSGLRDLRSRVEGSGLLGLVLRVEGFRVWAVRVKGFQDRGCRLKVQDDRIGGSGLRVQGTQIYELVEKAFSIEVQNNPRFMKGWIEGFGRIGLAFSNVKLSVSCNSSPCSVLL